MTADPRPTRIYLDQVLERPELAVAAVASEAPAAMREALARVAARAGWKIGSSGRTAIGPLVAVADLERELEGAGFAPDRLPQLVATLHAREVSAGAERVHASRRLMGVERMAARRGLTLFPYQRVTAAWLGGRRSGLVGHEMGLGKTICALAALPAGAPVLVLAPSVARGVWRREARTWRPDLEVSVLLTRLAFRWPRPGELAVATYDVLPRGRRLGSAPKGLVIVADEVHVVRSGDTRRTRRFRAVARAARHAGGRVWGLTGTPLLNRPPELWEVLTSIGCAAEAFGTYARFARLFDEQPRAGAWGRSAWGVPDPAVPPALRRVMLRFRQRDVLPELPALEHVFVPVALSATGHARLRRALERARARGVDPAELMSASARGRASAGGTSGAQELAEVRRALALAKLPAALELARRFEAAGRPLVVFSAHRRPVEVLGRRRGWGTITGATSPAARARIAADFQAGRLRGIAATIQAAGVSVTLTRAADALFIDRAWTPALNAQAEKRLHRIGQRRPVRILLLVADHAVDARVSELNDEKRALIAATVDAATVMLPITPPRHHARPHPLPART